MQQYTYPDGSIFVAASLVDDVLIDPELPTDFDNTPNEERSPAHMRWWGMPFIVTESVAALDARYAAMAGANADTARQHWATLGRRQWMEAWPTGMRYEVRCLDGGAWDRSSSWGMFKAMDEAVRCAKSRGVAAAPVLILSSPPDDRHLMPAVVKYEPAAVPVNDARREVQGARVRIETAGEAFETTVIPPEGNGPHGWIGAADRVEELNAQGLITLKLALVEAAQEGAAGKSGTIDLTRKKRGAVRRDPPRSDPPSPEALKRWRMEAEGLDGLALRGSARRARVAVMDVVVVLSLLDEVERLRNTLSLHAADGATSAGPIPADTLSRWRAEAESGKSGPDTLADRLVAAIQEIEGRRQGAAATLGAHPRRAPSGGNW